MRVQRFSRRLCPFERFLNLSGFTRVSGFILLKHTGSLLNHHSEGSGVALGHSTGKRDKGGKDPAAHVGQGPGTEPLMKQGSGMTVNVNDPMLLNHFQRFYWADGWRRQLFA